MCEKCWLNLEADQQFAHVPIPLVAFAVVRRVQPLI